MKITVLKCKITTGRKFAKAVLIAIFAIFIAQSMYAAPYNGEIQTFIQPDGTSITVKMYGDEYYGYFTDLNGATLIRENGWFYYAELNKSEDKLISTGVKYTVENEKKVSKKQTTTKKRTIKISEKAKREIIAKNKLLISNDEGNISPTSSVAPLYGNPNQFVKGAFKGLCILIDFPDEQGTIAQSEVDNYFNQQGYTGFSNNGSVRDYFYDVSNGNVDYTNVVTEYYTAQHPKTYYDTNTVYGRSVELMKEALDYLASANFDFSQLSMESETSNRIIAVNFFYAGRRSNGWTYGLWPHMRTLGYTFTAGGVNYTAGYVQISDMTSSLTLGTVCHENGHMLMKWPDLYDYGYESNGLGRFCLMSGGGHGVNPSAPNPYLRQRAGWQTPIELNEMNSPSIIHAPANAFTSYIYRHPSSSNEFFLVENVKKEGRWKNLPGSGLLIWHIDENGSNNNEQMTPSMHYMVSLEQADGLFDLENDRSSDINDIYHAGNASIFNAVSTPNSHWWDNTPSGLGIVSIGAIADTMTFTYSTGTGNYMVELQAEDQNWSNATVDNNHAGFTGTGFVNTANNIGEWLEFTFEILSGGEFDLYTTYANGNANERPAEIYVNGELYLTELFYSTGAWNVWDIEESFANPVNLLTGTNTIRFVGTSADGLSNIDKITLNKLAKNKAPVIVDSLGPINAYQTDDPFLIDISSIFEDPEGGPLTYSFSSTGDNIGNIKKDSPSEIKVTLYYEGNSDVTVTAYDLLGATKSYTFTINSQANSRPHKDYSKDFYNFKLCMSYGAIQFDLDTIFTDEDGDPLTYSVEMNENVEASISSSILTLTPLAPSTDSLIIITATDSKNASGYEYVYVSVVESNTVPEITAQIEDIVMYHSQTYALDPTIYFYDADGDDLTLSYENIPSEIDIYDWYGGDIYFNFYPYNSEDKTMPSTPITIYASDNSSCGALNKVYQTFNIEVIENHNPEITGKIPPQRFYLHTGTQEIDLSQVFTDIDGHNLKFTAYRNYMDPQIFDYSTNGSIIEITPTDTGTAILNVRCYDDFGGYSEYIEITITIEETPSLEYQAEDQTWSNATVDNNHAGFTGTGFVNTANNIGEWIEFEVTAIEGIYDLEFYYANGGTADRTGELFVNGTLQKSENFAPTSNWRSWAIQPYNGIPLNSGINTIRLTSTTSDGLSNIDKLNLIQLPQNEAPYVLNNLEIPVLTEVNSSYSIDLSNIFADPENDPLQISVSVNNTNVATANVDGTTLFVNRAGNDNIENQTTLQFIVSDGFSEITYTATVEINSSPYIVSNPTDSITMNTGETVSVNLFDIFNDKDNEPLLFTAVGNASSLFFASVNENILTITSIAGSDACFISLECADAYHSPMQFDLYVVINEAPPSFELQAEDQTWSNATVDNNHAGFTGTGFVNTANNIGEWIEFTVNAPTTADYDWFITYGHNGPSDRNATITLNGQSLIDASFYPTGAWNAWDVVSSENDPMTLTQGVNTIRIIANNTDGLANIDKLNLTPVINSALKSFTETEITFEESNSDDIFSCTPNIVKGTSTIQCRLQKPGSISIELTDALGITVDVIYNGYSSSEDYTATLQNNYPAGVYTLVLKTEYYIETEKIIIE